MPVPLSNANMPQSYLSIYLECDNLCENGYIYIYIYIFLYFYISIFTLVIKKVVPNKDCDTSVTWGISMHQLVIASSAKGF